MKKKSIHFIDIYYCSCRAICSLDVDVHPIEDKCDFYKAKKWNNLGTFDVTKVTCKKCLKSKVYKDYIKKLDAEEMPLFYGDYRN